MNLREIVENNYVRLELEREQDLAPVPEAHLLVYPQWAHGKVLLDHQATLVARRYCVMGDGMYARMLDQVRDILTQLNERALVPALSYDAKRRYVVLLVIPPR